MLKVILLTAISLCLAGCPADSMFPVDYTYITDLQHSVCSQWLISDKVEFKFTWMRDMPLEVGGPCDGMVGFSRQDYPKVRNWLKEQTGNKTQSPDDLDKYMDLSNAILD